MNLAIILLANAEHAMSITKIWSDMGLLSKAVAIALVLMGLVSAFITVERLLVLQKAMRFSGEFAVKARPLLEARDIQGLLGLTKTSTFRVAPLPRLYRFGLESFKVNIEDTAVGPVEMTRRELNRKLEVLGAEARRGMGFLASTGSTAPFIGLFGTVIGIITVFSAMSAAGGGGISVVIGGISEALIVTAVGLVIAIGAVLAFNYLTHQFERFDMMMQHAASELIDYLEGSDGRSA